MNELELKVAVGGLLHDIGKVLYRYNDGRSHSTSGYEYVKNVVGIEDADVLDQIRYHHSAQLKSAKIPNNSLAYITYIADNIASAADRRKASDEGIGFVRELPLETVFNRLNENDQKMTYPAALLDGEKVIFPKDTASKYTDDFYSSCIDNISNCIKGYTFDNSYINSLLEVLEANLSFVPSSTSTSEVADISLFDHVKLTAALGSCIFAYLQAEKTPDYKSELFENAQTFYSKKTFLLYSVDISGIQEFIYTVSSDGALKMLRSRSFYLEILMEHIVDELLDKLNLSRANLVYCGGGHAYMLLANTEKTKNKIALNEKNINDWLLSVFGIELYIAGGFCECSASDIKNEPQGSYREIFKGVANDISAKKSSRYTAEEILKLNSATTAGGERECSACGRVEQDMQETKCSICTAIERFSGEVLYKDYFSIIKNSSEGLPLPGGFSLVADDKDSLINRMKNSQDYIRSYCKNEMHTGYNLSTKIYVGDYKNGDDFKSLATSSDGISRLGVLRADIDNLGKAFVNGFESEKNKDYYVTLSRTATLSRKLSIFFKRHINGILKEGSYFLNDDDSNERNIAIVYSGGDDVFVVGGWSDVIGFAVDLYEAFDGYSQSTLTISAGIGLFPEKYPVSAMARQTQELEEMSKSNPGKNSVTLFSKEGCYDWHTFINDVLEDKYRTIQEFFDEANNDSYGKAFLYKLLELIRNREEKINIARLAYLLARMEPKVKNGDEKGQRLLGLYQTFSKNLYGWLTDDEQCRQCITAIYIYVYGTRDKEEEK